MAARAAVALSLVLAQEQASALVHTAPLAGARARTALRGIDVNVWDYTFDNQNPGIEPPAKRWGVDGAPPPFQLSADALEVLHRDGVVHVPGVLDPEWLAHARALTDHQVAHPHIWASPGVASGLYDYVQRNVWSTNDGFAKFLYHSPVAGVLAQLGGAKSSVRLTTDLLMVNPNKGFKWHQDNQNGPVGWDESLRFWVTMDDTPRDYGAPVYLRRSHENTCVDDDAVFVNLEEGDLPNYSSDLIEFRPRAGDMIVWHPRTIHKIDGPDSQDWGKAQRRVLGGTVALDDAKYLDKEKVEFADLGRHDLIHGMPLADAHFPQLWPRPVEAEMAQRFSGGVGRSMPGFARMLSQMFSFKTLQQFQSWGNVLKNDGPVDADADADAAEPSKTYARASSKA
mmetsp:Transcript_18/g.70  ORF Transcript_18/g.70 Transcript_18/m.70 type:complete len:397 (-) Transcript_18:112-1302(-)